MENAKWKERVYTATEISEVYELEKQIRKASENGELICIDPNCVHPILRYCHGEIKHPYFAHRENDEQCDYNRFDRETSKAVKEIQHGLYKHFLSMGFTVKQEEKISPQYYANLLLTLSSGEKIAIVLGTKRTTAKKIESVNECVDAGVKIKWIIIDDQDTPVKENKTFFLKRYLLNENKRKDVLILNFAGTRITQFVEDPNLYLIGGQRIHSENYPDFYKESEDLSRLTFEDGELTISGFYQRYENWLTKKQKAFNKKLQEKSSSPSLPQTQTSKTFNKTLTEDEMEKLRVQLRESSEPIWTGDFKWRLCLHCNGLKLSKDCDFYIRYENNRNLTCCKNCRDNNIPKNY